MNSSKMKRICQKKYTTFWGVRFQSIRKTDFQMYLTYCMPLKPYNDSAEKPLLAGESVRYAFLKLPLKLGCLKLASAASRKRKTA